MPSRALALAGFASMLSLYAVSLLTSFRTQRLKAEAGFRIGNHFSFTGLDHAHHRVRRPQVDPDNVWVDTPEGLHLRKCAAIAEMVGKYQARVTLQKGDHSEDAASVLSLMLLAATQGTPLTVSATGPEAELAVRAVVDLF